jgi:WD40 repeat protein
VALQTPWLVLIDVNKQAEVGRALPSESYLRKDIPGRPRMEAGVRICHLSVDPQNGYVAVVFNTGKKTDLYVYDSDLKRQVASRELPRMVKDLCWSPDGTELAVLYHGNYDENRELVGGSLWGMSSEPDVWLMDPRSGQPLHKFSTGTPEDQIAFSKDGRLIYVINDYLHQPRGGVIGVFSRDHRGAIRVFSAVSGELVQTISAGPKGVHSGFSLSPDGSLIAADASTYVPLILGWREMEQPSGKIARVVLLDAKTGDLLFEHHETTYGDISEPLGLAFSPDGRLLFVDFPRGDKYPYQRIEVYSLDDVNGSKH